MNVAFRPTMTLADFLAWEERQELAYEFDGVRAIPVVGGTSAHSLIQSNLIAALVNRLRGTSYRVYGSHMKLHVQGHIRYPDAFLVCTPVARDAKMVADPVIVFEILSDSTAVNDLVVKNAEFRATPSIQRYVVLQQTDIAAVMFVRQGEAWEMEPVAGADAMLALPEIDITLPLAELYADIPD